MAGRERRAWSISDKSQIFREVIAPWLDVSTSNAWWIGQAIKQFPLEEVGIEELLRWVSGNPEVRVRTVAEIIGPPASRVSDYTRCYLNDLASRIQEGFSMALLFLALGQDQHQNGSKVKFKKQRVGK